MTQRLTVQSGKTISMPDGDLMITAKDVDLSGTVNSVMVPFTRPKAAGATLSLGSELADVQITNDEMSRITSSGGVLIGSTTTGSITIVG